MRWKIIYRRRVGAESPQAADAPEHTGLAAWLSRYRRFIPFPIALLLLVIFRPKVWDDPSVDALITASGFLLCMTGQSLRLWAWGSNAIVAASGVRDRGAYALMRHPLYAGNFLIAAGLAVVYNHPLAYLLLLAPFAWIYNAITRSEEQYMIETFPSDYQRYTAKSLPRFLPALRNLGSAVRTTSPFGWRFAWRKEYASCCAWLAGLAGLELYKEVLAHRWTRSWPNNWFWVGVMGICATVVLALSLRKRR
ncbi:MAG: methyltransferase family protein [Candidatus Binatia bacterium]